MASINVPKDDLLVLKSIAELSERQFDALVSALAKTKPTLTQAQFRRSIFRNVKTISPENVSSILRVLFILYSLKQRAELSSKELAKSISASARQSDAKGKDGVPLSPEMSKVLAERLKCLLGLESLAVTAKALDVMTEHEHIFCSARILSDIRPVFPNDPTAASAAVIVHNLQVGYHHNGEHQQFYVALDTDDIQQLKHLVARAEEKTKALKSILVKAKTDYLEP